MWRSKVYEHEHPLHLIDLNPSFPHYEQVYKEEDEEEEEGYVKKAITQQDFRCRPCNRCKQEITWFHRHYYECSTSLISSSSSSCDYWVHKFCGELPVTLTHTSHTAHGQTLDLCYYEDYKWYCVLCGTNKKSGLCYECPSCVFGIHANCARASVDDRIIYHPSHQHALTAIIPNPLLSYCDACGKEHKGIFYFCTMYCDFSIHCDCAFLPQMLMIQEPTNHTFSHPHTLLLSYSFPKKEQKAKFDPRCRVCNKFFDDESLWIYKCDNCRYYTHLDCATSRQEPFLSIISSYGNRLKKNFKDVDYPNLVRLPFQDESDSMLKQLFSRPAFQLMEDEVQDYYFHQHPLIVVRNECSSDIENEMPSASSSSSSRRRRRNYHDVHNPMKKIQVLCNACVRPITSSSLPFYKCVDDSCNFVLHEWCTRLPSQLTNYPLHLHHSLTLQPKLNPKFSFFGVFTCSVCKYPCNGFAYSCADQHDCDYHIDVKCGFIPEKITHDAHPGHLLSRVQNKTHQTLCRLCLHLSSEELFSFLCDTCEQMWVHIECALLLPREIRHCYDAHPMSLTYFPVEDHKGEYFCEICEMEFDPERFFYHCRYCAYFIHPDCAPLILQSEAASTSSTYNRDRIYKYLNIKFGDILNAKWHQHPLSFVQGIKRDGNCTRCNTRAHFKMIFRCLQCKFVIHWECLAEEEAN